MPFTPDSRNPVFQSSFACHGPCSQPSSLGNITAHVHAPSSWLSSQRLARAHAHSSIEKTNELQFMKIKLVPLKQVGFSAEALKPTSADYFEDMIPPLLVSSHFFK